MSHSSTFSQSQTTRLAGLLACGRLPSGLAGARRTAKPAHRDACRLQARLSASCACWARASLRLPCLCLRGCPRHDMEMLAVSAMPEAQTSPGVEIALAAAAALRHPGPPTDLQRRRKNDATPYRVRRRRCHLLLVIRRRRLGAACGGCVHWHCQRLPLKLNPTYSTRWP